ncbi:MAG: hypothetical protein ACI4ST_06370 [Candidatus Gallimonas sp.]
MRDALYEESAQSQKAKSEARMYTVIHVLSIVFIVLGIVQLLICMMVVPGIIGQYTNPQEGEAQLTGLGLAIGLIMWIGPVALWALMAFLAYRFKRRFNLSFDYLFVEDELRITKVFNGKKRKYLVTLKTDQMLKIGNCEDEEGFENTVRGLNGKKPKFMTPNREPAEGKMFIYILYSSSIEKNVYVIECRMEMLEYIVRAAGRNKLEWKR